MHHEQVFPLFFGSCFPALATKCAGSRPGHAHPHNLLLLSLSSNLSRCTFSQMGGERKEEEENDYYGQEKLVQQKHFFSFPGAWQNVADVGEKCAYFCPRTTPPPIFPRRRKIWINSMFRIFFRRGRQSVDGERICRSAACVWWNHVCRAERCSSSKFVKCFFFLLLRLLLLFP